MLGYNDIHLIFGFYWPDLTWKEPYKDMMPEKVFDAIQQRVGKETSPLSLLYNPDSESLFIGVQPGYTKEDVAFETFEQMVQYIIDAVKDFVEEDELRLGSLVDEFTVCIS